MNGQRNARRWRRLGIALAAVIICGSLVPAAEMTVEDRTGTQITVPHPTRATVLLFLRLGQAQSLAVIEDVRRILTDLPEAQVVVVLSGQLQEDRVNELAGEMTWPIVIDRDYSLVGTHKIRAWPTTLIIMSNGDELARLSGLPGAYSEHVQAYLAFAAGTIDRQTLNSRLPSAGTIADDPYQNALRHLRVAERLMDKGLVMAAAVELDKGLQLQPDEPRLLLAQARRLLLLGQPHQAMEVLARLDSASALGPKIDVRKGGALVMLKKWDEAIEVLEKAAKLNPDPSEAMYLLGVAYQQAGRWADAAKAFRTAFEATPTGRNTAAILEPAKKTPTTQPAPAEPATQPATAPVSPAPE